MCSAAAASAEYDGCLALWYREICSEYLPVAVVRYQSFASIAFSMLCEEVKEGCEEQVEYYHEEY